MTPTKIENGEVKWLALELRSTYLKDFEGACRAHMRGRIHARWLVDQIISGDIAEDFAILNLGFVCGILIQSNDLKAADMIELFNKARTGMDKNVSGEVNTEMHPFGING